MLTGKFCDNFAVGAGIWKEVVCFESFCLSSVVDGMTFTFWTEAAQRKFRECDVHTRFKVLGGILIAVHVLVLEAAGH